MHSLLILGKAPPQPAADFALAYQLSCKNTKIRPNSQAAEAKKLYK